MLNVKENHLCNLYYLRTASDQYGCQVNPSEFNLSEPVLNIIKENGNVNAEVGIVLLALLWLHNVVVVVYLYAMVSNDSYLLSCIRSKPNHPCWQ